MQNEEDDVTCSDEYEIPTDTVFTRLTEVVRKHYFGYLKKQLQENWWAWKGNEHECDLSASNAIEKCTELLEDKALKACMMTQIYQRTMVKIIAKVRRESQACRLQKELRKLIITKELTVDRSVQVQTTATQTDEHTNDSDKKHYLDSYTPCKDGLPTLTLDDKIQMFEACLNKKNAAVIAAAKQQRHNNRKHGATEMRQQQQQLRHKRTRTLMTISRSPTPPTPTSTKAKAANEMPVVPNTNSTCAASTSEHDDTIAKELAQLFSDEKTELDEIFGIDPMAEPDDPQINIILREIENAKLTLDVPTVTTEKTVLITLARDIKETPNYVCKEQHTANTNLPVLHEANSNPMQHQPTLKTDLRNSLWPCELFMQRRRLTDSLNHLIEEDFRWHEIMKWKFATLFGEDSDDEFATCSPTIELNDELICSCIRRITPWMVKHLMKPMRDGLIANRFLFKKLAKKLARNIILENQYPTESMIKTAVEDFFCLHQAVMTVKDFED